MRVIKAADYGDLCRKAAVLISAQMIVKPDSVLGFATGSTPEGVYTELVRLSIAGVISFKDIVSFNLDEYCGLKREHPQSYYYFMWKKLFEHVDIDEKNVHLPKGDAADPQKECEDYERMIAQAGGIDLQLLGIGRNGHIGFNEPAAAFAARTHTESLSEDTLKANARFFEEGEMPPEEAITMGIGTIMKAGSILLIANGPGKKDALDKTINGPVTPEVPASILQYHPNATIIYCD